MTVRWTSSALKRRAEIIEYIEEDNPIAALTIDNAFENAAEFLSKNPRIGRTGRLDGTREWIVGKNYILIYLIEGNEIIVLTIVHGAQNFPPHPFTQYA